jgi:hypothetical protein
LFYPFRLVLSGDEFNKKIDCMQKDGNIEAGIDMNIDEIRQALQIMLPNPMSTKD